MADIIFDWLFGGRKGAQRIPPGKGKKRFIRRRNKKKEVEQGNSISAQRQGINTYCSRTNEGQSNALTVILNYFFIAKERRTTSLKMVLDSFVYLIALVLNEIKDKEEKSITLQNTLLTLAAASDAIESKRTMAAVLAEASGKQEH